MVGFFAAPTSAQQTVYTQDGRVVVVQDNQNTQYDHDNRDNDRHNRRNWRNRGNRRYDKKQDRNYDNNYGYVVRNEQRYIRVGSRVYREIYRSTYTRYGQLVARQLISRERVRSYDNYSERDYRNRGILFNIFKILT